MTTEEKPTIRAGDTVHVLAAIPVPTGDFFGGGFLAERGTEFVVTPEMIEAARNRLGHPGWPSIVHDDDAQLAKWGKVIFRPGPAPADLERWTYGDPLWAEQREILRKAAWAEKDPERRAAALAAVQQRFGAAPKTSTHVRAPKYNYWEQKNEEQAARRALDGKRTNRSTYSGEDNFMFPDPKDGS